jgi:hypothetical protein
MTRKIIVIISDFCTQWGPGPTPLTPPLTIIMLLLASISQIINLKVKSDLQQCCSNQGDFRMAKKRSKDNWKLLIFVSMESLFIKDDLMKPGNSHAVPCLQLGSVEYLIFICLLLRHPPPCSVDTRFSGQCSFKGTVIWTIVWYVMLFSRK